MSRPTHIGCALSLLLAAVATAGIATYLGILMHEGARRRVHVSEQFAADRIRRLGGAYRAVKANGSHITSIWLANTQASDTDVAVLLKLGRLEYMDVSNTLVSDVSLPGIFSHPRLRVLKTTGSQISTRGLQAELSKPGNQISLDN